ncbi:hypothetical protein IH980_03250 [Patescibacteria group bacterium]|nr:hypothetical protein [Patescibacteria group bacterium]
MISANRIIAKLHKDFLLATVIFVVAMVVYLSNGRMIESSDVVPASVLPVLNVREKTIYFDDMLSEVQYYIHGRNPYDYFLVKTRGHVVSWFPIVLPVVLIPLYFFYNLSLEIRNIPFSFYNFKYVESHISFLKLSASLIAAFSGVSLYLILKMIWKSSKVALLTTFIYLFCASAWVINSQELWQHGLGNLLFFILIFLYLLTAVYGFSKSIFYTSSWGVR